MKKKYLQPQLAKKESVLKLNLLDPSPSIPVYDQSSGGEDDTENEVDDIEDLLVKPNYSLWND